MTFLQAIVAYETPVGEREMSALNGVHDGYGICLMKFSQEMNTVTIEYDASRLTRSDIEFMLSECWNSATEPSGQSGVTSNGGIGQSNGARKFTLRSLAALCGSCHLT